MNLNSFLINSISICTALMLCAIPAYSQAELQAPDYSLASSWSALPNAVDSADVTPPEMTDNQAHAEVDVFFIHPTSYSGKILNASIEDEKTNLKTDSKSTKHQASVFNGSCKVYVPRYRQASIKAFYKKSDAAKQAFDLAYEDVKAAFEYYIENYNNGRPFILASHSQGTKHGVKLLSQLIENKPIQDLMVAAYLVGFSVPDSSFTSTPVCESPNQTNCYVTWSTYKEGHIPKRYAAFFEGTKCVNPVSWLRDETVVKREHHKGASLKELKNIQSKLFDTQIHDNILWITKPDIKGKTFILFKNFHAGDYNLFYKDIRENVALRIRHYLAEHAAK